MKNSGIKREYSGYPGGDSRLMPELTSLTDSSTAAGYAGIVCGVTRRTRRVARLARRSQTLLARCLAIGAALTPACSGESGAGDGAGLVIAGRERDSSVGRAIAPDDGRVVRRGGVGRRRGH